MTVNNPVAQRRNPEGRTVRSMPRRAVRLESYKKTFVRDGTSEQRPRLLRDGPRLLIYPLIEAAGDPHTAQPAHVLGNSTIQRFSNPLAVFGGLQTAFVTGIADE